MMDEKLQKRISDAIADGESDSPDEELSKEIENDEEAFQFFEDVQAIEKKLRDWSYEAPPREYWKTFVKRINGRLDSDEPADDESFLAPPAPDEPEEQEAPAEAEEEQASDEASESEDGESEDDEAAGIGALAGLAGHSTVPPLAAFDDDLPSRTEEAEEDSGLIDLAALAKAEEETAKKTLEKKKAAAAAAAPAKADTKGEKLAKPAAPIAAAQEEKSNTGLYAIVGVLVVALVVVSIFALRSGDDAEDTSTSGAIAQAPAETAAPAPATPVAAEPAEAPAAATDEEPGEAATEDPEGEAASAEDDGEGEEPEESGRVASARNGSKARAPRREKSDRTATPAAAAPEPAPTTPRPAPTPRPAAKAPAKGTAGDLDDLLARATGGGSTPTKRPSKAGGDDPVRSAIGSGDSAEPSLPDQPSRAQVRRAMRSVSGQVMACKSLVDSMTRVNATLVVSSSGGVNSVNVSGGSAAAQQCVSRAVKRARFPRFKQASFTVTYPFVLSPPQ